MAGYVIGKYIRLSQADRDTFLKEGKTESESISHQRELLQNFIQNHEDLKPCRQLEFFDDGYSGTNFERPAFEKMMEKVKKGEITCIIVKDFSRFGRDYIELGDYLERIFPYLGVRFISVNDGYDSADYKGTTGGLDVVMKNIVYDYYSKDLSVKVSTAKYHKMKRGEYIGGHVPYGLKKHESIKNKLAVDEEAAKVVREIFSLAIEGKGITEIAHIMNERGHETPGAYYRRKHPGTKKFANASSLSSWTVTNVRSILKQEMYYGATVGHKREKVAVNSKVTRSVPKSEQFIVEGMHEAVVEKEVFLEAQKIFRTGYKKKTDKSYDYPLQGKVRCGCCRRAMNYKYGVVRGREYKYFGCVHAIYQDGKSCSKRYIKEDVLNAVVFEAVQKMVALAEKASQIVQQKKAESKENSLELTKTLAELQRKLEKCNTEKFANIDRFMAGNLKKELYQKRRMELAKQAEELEKQIGEMKQNMQNVELGSNSDVEQGLEKIAEYKDSEKLDKMMVRSLVKTVYVYDSEHVEIEWKFSDELKELLNME